MVWSVLDLCEMEDNDWFVWSAMGDGTIWVFDCWFVDIGLIWVINVWLGLTWIFGWNRGMDREKNFITIWREKKKIFIWIRGIVSRLVYIYIKQRKGFAIYLYKYTAIVAYRGMWQQKQRDKCLRSTYSCALHMTLEHISLPFCCHIPSYVIAAYNWYKYAAKSFPLKNGLAKIENVGIYLLINLVKTLLSLVWLL